MDNNKGLPVWAHKAGLRLTQLVNESDDNRRHTLPFAIIKDGDEVWLVVSGKAEKVGGQPKSSLTN